MGARWSAIALIAGLAWVGIAVAAEELELHDLEFLHQYSATNAFTLGQPVRHAITDGGETVLFLRSGPRSFVHDLWQFDCDTGEERVLLTADAILQGAEEHLTAAEKARRERARHSQQGIASFAVSRDGAKILVPLSGKLYVVERATGNVMELTNAGDHPLDARFSPDGRHVSYVSDSELYVIDVASGARAQLTHSATETVSNGLAEFIAQEEIRRHHGYWWSPDADVIACQQTDVEGVEVMRILDPANPQRGVDEWPYPRAGQKNADVKLALVPLDGAEPVWVQWDRETYPYLVDAVWQQNAPLTLVVHNRKQTEALVLAVDPGSGVTRTLHRERDAAWLQFEHSVPHWLPDGSAWLWSTERNGSWQLELHASVGRRLHMLNPMSLRYKKLLGVEPGAQSVLVQAWTDPTELHLFRLSMDGRGEPQQLTTEPGEHSATVSKNGETYVHIADLRDAPARQEILRRGEVVGELKSFNEPAPIMPNVEYVTLDPPHDFRAAVLRPIDFDSEQRYPVLVRVYGGPYSRMVRAVQRRHVLDQWYADNGFIVVKIDGRGTPGRGREWERAIRGNLIQISLEDQVLGLQQLAARYPEIDLERVAIYGWSFGGYFSSMAVMRRPDVFRAGVAGAPVVDWSDYSTYYTERYMGLPQENVEGYEDANVLTHVRDLQRPLMILHGTADDNVYFMHSMKLVDALFHAGKDFEFVPLTDLTHSVRDVSTRARMFERIFKFVRKNVDVVESPRP